jgi:tetratricopeptide (TPR) repeat protein
MRKHRWLAFTGLALLLMTSVGFAASSSARTFMDGIDAYRKGDWPAAITAFKRIADSGVDNGKLDYNLGNAYLKNHDLGHAILWYERALKRIPHDPDLRFNYDYALTLTKDEPGEKGSPLLHILFFWEYQLSHATVCWIAICLNAALWLALAILAVRKKRLLRPSIILTAAATLIFSVTAVVNYVDAARIRQAVILPAKVAVRSGFGDSATQLFVLHAGTKVRVERVEDNHLLIRYTEGKIGWVKKSDAGII